MVPTSTPREPIESPPGAAASSQHAEAAPLAAEARGVDSALNAVLEATRALLWVETSSDAAAVALDLVKALGGSTVPARMPGSDALPVDISFGATEPVLPSAPTASIARMHLDRHLAVFVRDAQRALELADRTSRLAEDATLDALTGLPNRRMLGRALGRIRPSATVIMLDLDHFKAVNDTLGHQEGDRVLRVFGHILASTVRASDHVGRYGGEEFVVILASNEAEPFLTRLRREWTESRPHPISFSAGVALAGPDPTRALEAADRAMYRAKTSGRDQWQFARKEDYLWGR